MPLAGEGTLEVQVEGWRRTVTPKSYSKSVETTWDGPDGWESSNWVADMQAESDKTTKSIPIPNHLSHDLDGRRGDT